MSRESIGYEKKYRYLLYRVQQALLEMSLDPPAHRGRRQLENGLYSCEGWIDPRFSLVPHEEMTAIKKEIFTEEPKV